LRWNAVRSITIGTEHTWVTHPQYELMAEALLVLRERVSLLDARNSCERVAR
jgi:hypothetical protein